MNLYLLVLVVSAGCQSGRRAGLGKLEKFADYPPGEHSGKLLRAEGFTNHQHRRPPMGVEQVVTEW
jgi:hypothetical protein